MAENTLLITLAVTTADLQSAYKLALCIGEEQASILQVSPLSMESLVDLSHQLFQMAKERGLLDEGKAKLIAGVIQSADIDKAREERHVNTQ